MLNKRFLPAWVLGLPISYITLGFLDAYYTSIFEIILVSFFVSTLTSLSVHFVLLRLVRTFKTRRVDAILSMLMGGATLVFSLHLSTWQAASRACSM